MFVPSLSSLLISKNYLFNRLYNVLTCTPVAPFGRYFSAFDRYAVPAISKCTHGTSFATKFSINNPAVIVPPSLPPVFLTSATEDFILIL